MKASFLSILLILGLISNINAQNQSNDCLLIYYPFNGNTIDSSNNGNNAIIHGATLTYDLFGNINSAYELSGNSGLNGSDVYIEVPNVVDSLENLTVSLWVKQNSYSYTNYGETYFSFGTLPLMGNTTTAIYYNLDYNSIDFYVMTENGKYSCSTPFLNSWIGSYQHFALVYDGVNGILKGYHNGVLVASNSNVSGRIESLGNYGALGKHWWANGAGYSTRLNCAFDEVKVYRCALDSLQIFDEYNTYLTASINNQQSQSFSSRVYPNPINNACTFEFNNPNKEKLNLVLYNSLGQIIREFTDIKTNKFIFKKANLSSGFYFYSISNDSEVLDEGKLIIE